MRSNARYPIIMAASALFILDLKGRVILSRDYRGDISAKSIERFISKVSELEETGAFKIATSLSSSLKLCKEHRTVLTQTGAAAQCGRTSLFPVTLPVNVISASPHDSLQGSKVLKRGAASKEFASVLL